MSKKKFFTTKKKLLLVGGVLFSVALITSIATTYAWYSVVEKAYVGNLNMVISSDMELHMGVKKDGVIDYSKSEYTKEDFLDPDKEFNLHDVSGMYEDEWKNKGLDPQFYSSFGLKNPHASSGKYATKQEDYLQMEFFLMSNVDCAVMLGPDSGFTPDNDHNERVAKRLDGTYVNDLDAIVDATRVSFFFDNEYVVAKNNADSPDTYYGGLLDLNDDGYYDYDAANNEIVYGEYVHVGGSSYSYPTYDGYGSNEGVFVANHKPGVTQADLSQYSIKKENAVSIDSLKFNEEMVGQQLDPLLMLKAGEAKRIVITIYLEGWDRKMTNSIDFASMNAIVSFVPLYNYKA